MRGDVAMANVKSTKITSADGTSDVMNNAIIGTYEGECADANITNLNGLDITREVWENVFASDVYKQAIENGWYIGFLGHPEGEDSADCQDFRRACIVMTEGHIEDNGKVYGKFNLIDTPVGRIVKAFQDAGVTFGISVRGAGDIIQNSVDPDTFVFRGFDLVTFPAFPESIPKFTAIAASTDVEQRKKYQAVCASVKENMAGLSTVESINIVQSCFAKQSDEYAELEAHKAAILGGDGEVSQLSGQPFAEPGVAAFNEKLVDEAFEKDKVEIDPRVESMTKLYLELKEKYDTLSLAHQGLQSMYDQLVKDNTRKIESIERICSSQINDLSKTLEKVEGSLRTTRKEAVSLRTQLKANASKLSKVQSSVSTKTKRIEDLELESTSLIEKLQSVRASLKAEQNKNRRLRRDLNDVSTELNECKDQNLKYIQKVKAHQSTIENKDSIISSLQSKLDETVRKHAQEIRASNRDEEVEDLRSKVTEAESITRSYQDAYAKLYANALGISTPQLRVTANTDVHELQNLIRSGTSIAIKPDFLEPTQGADDSYFDVIDYDEDDLVTL